MDYYCPCCGNRILNPVVLNRTIHCKRCNEVSFEYDVKSYSRTRSEHLPPQLESLAYTWGIQ